MFEHYTYASRKAIVWNPVGFNVLVLSIEYVYRIIRQILIFVEADIKYIDEVDKALKELHKILCKE